MTDIRTVPTSELIAALITDAQLRARRAVDEQVSAKARAAIAAEIDRRIPASDPRIGKLCRLRDSHVAIARCVAIEPGGALRLRDDRWSPYMSDYRAMPDEVEWIEESEVTVSDLRSTP